MIMIYLVVLLSAVVQSTTAEKPLYEFKYLTAQVTRRMSGDEPFFIVLNDIHTHATYQASYKRLSWFCREAVPSIARHGNLKYIVLAGDVVDSGAPLLSLAGPGQREEEWRLLQVALEGCVKVVPVLPIRGNHDCFNVEWYGHVSNEYWLRFREWIDVENAKKGVVQEIFLEGKEKPVLERVGLGSWVAFVPGNSNSKNLGSMRPDVKNFHNLQSNQDYYPVVLLDSSLAGINRHFFARHPAEVDAWLNSVFTRLSLNIQVNKRIIPVFSHFPTGTYFPSDRERLLETLSKHAKFISGFHSGHIHFLLGSRIQTIHDGETIIPEYELSDFASSAVIRFVGLSSNMVINVNVKSESLPLLGATSFQSYSAGAFIDYAEMSKCVYAVAFDTKPVTEVEAVTGEGHAAGRRLMKSLGGGFFEDCENKFPGFLEVEAHGKTTRIVENEFFTGIWKWLFLHNYESGAIAALIVYIIMVCCLCWFYKRTDTLVDRLVVILGIIFPVLPWAIGYGWLDRLCICGVWGQVDLDTWERRPMDLNTFQMIPLMIRVIVKVGALSTKPGSIIQICLSVALTGITLIGFKLLMLTYGPFLFLSPLVIWEFACWAIKGKNLLLRIFGPILEANKLKND